VKGRNIFYKIFSIQFVFLAGTLSKETNIIPLVHHLELKIMRVNFVAFMYIAQKLSVSASDWFKTVRVKQFTFLLKRTSKIECFQN
jgi:hypothetical protein